MVIVVLNWNWLDCDCDCDCVLVDHGVSVSLWGLMFDCIIVAILRSIENGCSSL